MLPPSTQDEWLRIIDKAQQDLSSVPPEYSVSQLTTGAVAETIDHTLLKPEASHTQVDALCDEAKQFGFKVRSLMSGRMAIDAFSVRLPRIVNQSDKAEHRLDS